MKLLKSKTCSRVFGGGNVKTGTTLVEVQWLGFRTGVRFPSPPLIREAPNLWVLALLVFLKEERGNAMIVIVCVDDMLGMAFHRRRQSRDRVVTERICRDCEGRNLFLHPYSETLFEAYPDTQRKVCEEYLKLAGEGDVCFVERESLKAYESKIEKIILYRWNRRYPSDVTFDVALSGWHLTEQEELEGFSHETITRDVYIKAKEGA